MSVSEAKKPLTEIRRKAMYCLVPVWGARYVQIYLDYVLASHLSPGNLPGLRYKEDHRYIIVTHEDCRALIENSPQYRMLRSIVRATIYVVPPPTTSTHDHMSDCYRVGISEADRDDAAIVFLFADGIFSDGSFPRLEQLLNAGYDAVFCAGIRVNDEATKQALQPMRRADGTLPISARALMRVGLRNLHEWTCGSFWEDDLPEGRSLPLLPANLLWRAGPDALLARCYHLHPILVYPQVKTTRFESTVDDYYFMAAGVVANRSYVIQDSDELCFVDLTDHNRVLITDMRKGSLTDAARWASCFANSFHRFIARKPIRLHAVEVGEASWRAVEERADGVMRSITQEIRRRERIWTIPEDPRYLSHYINRLRHEYQIRYQVRLARYEMLRTDLREIGRQRAGEYASSFATRSHRSILDTLAALLQRLRREREALERERAHLIVDRARSAHLLLTSVVRIERQALSARLHRAALELHILFLDTRRFFVERLIMLERTAARIRAWIPQAMFEASLKLQLGVLHASKLGAATRRTLQETHLMLLSLPARLKFCLNLRVPPLIHDWLFGPPDRPTVFSWRRSYVTRVLARFDRAYALCGGDGGAAPAYIALGRGDLLLARRAASHGARLYRLARDQSGEDTPTIESVDGGQKGRHRVLLVEAVHGFPEDCCCFDECVAALHEIAEPGGRLIVLNRYERGVEALIRGAPNLSGKPAWVAGEAGWHRVAASGIGGAGTLAFGRMLLDARDRMAVLPRLPAMRLTLKLLLWVVFFAVGPAVNWWIAERDGAEDGENAWSSLEVYESQPNETSQALMHG